MPYLAPALALLNFVFWLAVFGYWVPIGMISQAVIYGLACLDLLTTLGLHALSLCCLATAPDRFGRNWNTAVALLLFVAAGECMFRAVALAFGEPIFREVAAAMITSEIYICLPVLGLVIGMYFSIASKI